MSYNYRFFLSFLMILSFSFLQGQKILFDSLKYKMPIESAKAYIKTNKKKYKNFSLGKGTSYSIRNNSLVEKDQELVEVSFWSKKNLNLKQAEEYLVSTKAFLESKNYKVVYSQENWSKPLLMNKNKPCIRFVDENKNVVLAMEPRGQGSVYNVFLTYYNFDWFINQAKGTN